MSVVAGDGIRLRRAEPGDLDFLVELTTHDEVEPYLAGSRPRDREGVLAEIQRSQAEPEEFGRFVVEVAQDGDWHRAGSVGFELANRRSRIASLGNLAIHPAFRGRRHSDSAARLFQHHLLLELGFHRLQLEIYGFNERAQRHAERVGFVREGVRRRAYWRHDEWVDGVLYGLLREDLGAQINGPSTAEAPMSEVLSAHVERFNSGVRTGDFGPMTEAFAADAELAFEGVPVGPFRGREAIAAAYREQPPDDEILVLDTREEEDGLVVADYAWASAPDVRAGEMRLRYDGDRVTSLTVTFG